MPIPVQPPNTFARPFASAGAYQIIPDAPSGTPGRASLQLGFPPETQLPLSAGGIAPNRMDFQGILYMLSNFAFFQQSGGIWAWSGALNYSVPCMVFYAGKLWWCLAASGPETTAGAVAPGSNGAYWLDFVQSIIDAAVNSIPPAVEVSAKITGAVAAPTAKPDATGLITLNATELSGPAIKGQVPLNSTSSAASIPTDAGVTLPVPASGALSAPVPFDGYLRIDLVGTPRNTLYLRTYDANDTVEIITFPCYNAAEFYGVCVPIRKGHHWRWGFGDGTAIITSISAVLFRLGGY